MVSNSVPDSYATIEDKHILVAGAKGSGKTSLIFTLSRGIFPTGFLPGRFEGWSVAAVASPRDSPTGMPEHHKKQKPVLVNLTFWEDRPRLNLLEKLRQQQKQQQQQEEQQQQSECEKRGGGNQCQTETELHHRNGASHTVLQRRSSRRTLPPTGKPPTGKPRAAAAHPGEAGNRKWDETKNSADVETSKNKLDNGDCCCDGDFTRCDARPWLCPDPHVIVLSYSVVDLSSFLEAETTIWPELSEKFPNTPVILVANKCDIKDAHEFSTMDEKEQDITTEMGKTMARRIGAKAYIECSAAEQRGLRHVVEESVWILTDCPVGTDQDSQRSHSGKWSMSSSYPSARSSSLPGLKNRKTSESSTYHSRKISTTSVGSISHSGGVRPAISVQDPFSTSLPTATSPSTLRRRKASYGAAVRKIWHSYSNSKNPD